MGSTNLVPAASTVNTSQGFFRITLGKLALQMLLEAVIIGTAKPDFV
jgi:hypothetical protein